MGRVESIAARLAELLLDDEKLDDELWVAFAERCQERVRAVVDWSLQLCRWQLDGERGDVPGLTARVTQLVSHRAVRAEFVFPGDASSWWYLWDIDTSGFVVLADADVYDDADPAAEAWRGHVGAADPTVVVVDDPATFAASSTRHRQPADDVFGLLSFQDRRGRQA